MIKISDEHNHHFDSQPNKEESQVQNKYDGVYK
jgi:hypothetical protein